MFEVNRVRLLNCISLSTKNPFNSTDTIRSTLSCKIIRINKNMDRRHPGRQVSLDKLGQVMFGLKRTNMLIMYP